MKAPLFEYARAASVAEACELLRRHGDEAKLIAGGQSLVPMMAMRLLRPAWLIDVNEIEALKFITVESEVVRTGACARQAALERDAALGARVPLLKQALAWVGHVQTRNRGTVGGSLAHADPCAELPLVAQVLGARIRLRSAKGARDMVADEFFTGPMMTAMTPDECLEEIRWPAWHEPRTGSEFAELSVRHGDFAIVAAAAQIALDSAGRCTRAALGLGGVGLTPLAFQGLTARLVGTRPGENDFAQLAHDAAARCEPGTDLHASAAYRRHVAQVLATRALRAAHQRAESVQ
jgi:CO/xanthine dehydrogenase FAD-binding subunit